jgi:hypothetical protein
MPNMSFYKTLKVSAHHSTLHVLTNMVIIKCSNFFLCKLLCFGFHSFNFLVCGPLYAFVYPIMKGHSFSYEFVIATIQQKFGIKTNKTKQKIRIEL